MKLFRVKVVTWNKKNMKKLHNRISILLFYLDTFFLFFRFCSERNKHRKCIILAAGILYVRITHPEQKNTMRM